MNNGERDLSNFLQNFIEGRLAQYQNRILGHSDMPREITREYCLGYAAALLTILEEAKSREDREKQLSRMEAIDERFI